MEPQIWWPRPNPCWSLKWISIYLFNSNPFLSCSKLKIQVRGVEIMSSLPFSLGVAGCSTPRLVVRNLSTTEASPTPIKFSSYHYHQHHNINIHASSPRLNENPTTLLRRREAIGLSLCLGLFDVLSQPQPSAAAEAGTPSPCELTLAPSGLAYCDKVVGTGPEAVKGQLIKAHYVGKLESGKVFDSSYNRGKPLTFRVGVGEVIKGWDQGILGGDGVPPMLAGGKRTLKLPAELGYGMRGAGCKGGSCIIPPDSVLLFDVEFIGKASIPDLKPFLSHLKYVFLGDGETLPMITSS
ncbi:hypothetical protein F0562_029602 [Nyssa sinensis]|uniref:peptidylprolyl isomerase n=1 Tax=Nyssa sinensis TaxID=561372 RepID=A0A5J5B5T6_9ASTE|nr:hypothetical protein F0562_029602 [Nyssa sinensis]